MSNSIKILLVFLVAVAVGEAGGFAYWAISFQGGDDTDESTVSAPLTNTSSTGKPFTSKPTTSDSAAGKDVMAFLYQYVGPYRNGTGENAVRIGTTSDGTTVESYGMDALAFVASQNATNGYGDPVFSRLADGSWAMTAWTGKDDTRGANSLLYHESSCPIVDDEDVIALRPSSAAGCQKTQGLTGGKSSQVFEAENGNYVFHMIFGEIYLSHLSDETHSAMDLDSVCVLSQPAGSLSELDWGESTRILSKVENDGLLMSDTAVGQRTDGTWVLFVKGIAPDNGCTPNTVCELCARSIYRTTSSDLIHWSPLEEVVEEASVPEATQTVDGVVWLYWQDFSNVCETQNQMLGLRAPISAAYETEDSYELSDPVQVSFPDEAFETDEKIHYATNANPVMLPDADALSALEACMK